MLKVQLGLFLKKLVQEARFSPTSFPGRGESLGTRLDFPRWHP